MRKKHPFKSHHRDAAKVVRKKEAEPKRKHERVVKVRQYDPKTKKWRTRRYKHAVVILSLIHISEPRD